VTSLNYNHLRYFWAVAHEGNLTRAAERLHVSQSAVSVQIQKLESDLGHDLFERRGKQLILTEAGRIALDHADAIFSMGDELVGTLQERGNLARQVLRVGAIATLSRNFQLGFLRPLLGREDVEIVVRAGAFGDLMQSLQAHQLDVVLVNTAPPRDAATAWVPHAIAEQRVSLVGPPKRSRRQRPLRELLEQEPLVLPSTASSVRTGFDALVDRLGIRPRIAAEVDDMAMLRLLARERIGLAVVPSIVVKDELSSGVLVELEQLPGLKETFYAITLSRRFPNPLIKLLVAARDMADIVGE
jgi:LysR family transcriptional regulator, transcriptional activator of nhaA